MTCPFCKSEKTVMVTPYIDRVTGKPKTTYCCKAQAKNHEFEDKRYVPDTKDLETLEDIGL